MSDTASLEEAIAYLSDVHQLLLKRVNLGQGHALKWGFARSSNVVDEKDRVDTIAGATAVALERIVASQRSEMARAQRMLETAMGIKITAEEHLSRLGAGA